MSGAIDIAPVCNHSWTEHGESQVTECHRDAIGRFRILVEGEEVSIKHLCPGHARLYRFVEEVEIEKFD